MSCAASKRIVYIELIPGSKWSVKGCWKINGVKQPLADYKARMQVKETADSEPLLELTTENGAITIDEANDDFYIVIEAEQSSSLPIESVPKSFMFSVEFYIPLSSPEISYTFINGYFNIPFPEITK